MSTSLFLQTFRHNGSAVFGTMPPMCGGCPDVNKLRGIDATILGQHWPFMSIKLFVQHSGWQEMVSLCSLIRLIGVCADRDQPEFLCSRSDSGYLEVHVATAGGWLTRYRPREVRNSIYWYRKIRIDYWSKFLYRFISPISIIYGNTKFLQTTHGWPMGVGKFFGTHLCDLGSRSLPLYTGDATFVPPLCDYKTGQVAVEGRKEADRLPWSFKGGTQDV